jgi:hypothetical protein
MAAIANVTLIDTFDQWRIKTNQTIQYAYEIENKTNLVFDTTNASFNTVNAAFTQANTDNIRLSGAYVSLNSGYVVANAAFNHSNLTYNAANIIFNNVNAVYELTNSAFDVANSVYAQSNAEFLRLTNVFNIANNHEGRIDVLSGASDLVFDWSESNFNRTNACYEQANTDNVRLSAAYVSLNAAYVVVNAAFGLANTTPAQLAPVHSKLNVNYVTTNAAFAMINSAFTVLNAAYTSSNANYVLTNATYTSSNAGYTVANAAFLKANDAANLACTLSTSANAYARVFANTVGVAANTYAVSVGASGNAYTVAVGASGNAFTVSVGASANNWANTKVRTVSGTGGQITSSGGIDPILSLASFTGATGSFSGGITSISIDNFGRVSSVTTTGSQFSPIFYDQNNTSYFLDPNSGSRLATVDADYLYSRGDIRSAGWLYAIGRVVVGEGQTSSMIEMRDTDESTRFIHNNSGSIGFLGSHGSWRFRMFDDGNVIMGTYQDYLSNQIRSAIFYDQNDTYYQLDPNGTTRLARCEANIYYDREDYNYYMDPNHISYLNDIRPNIIYDRNNTGHYVDPNGSTYLNTLYGNYIESYDQMRANIFYDRHDTNYYVQPRSVSYFNDIRPNIMYDRQDTGWYSDPNGTSRLMFVQFGSNRWHRSEEGWQRFYFENSSSTYLQGGTTGQWYIRFGTSNDGATRSIMEGGGNFYTNGNVVAYWSDKRLKKNIEKITDWREIINGLNGYRFQWNDTGKKMLEMTDDVVEVGLIAQEVEAVLPQASAIQMLQYKDNVDGKLIPKDDINYDSENPYLTVREEKIIPVLVEAIKGLMAEIDELKARGN